MPQTRYFAAVSSLASLLVPSACTSYVPDELPPNAVLVAEGNRRLAFRAPDDGTIYVYDNTNQRLLFASEIERDQMLSVSSKGNRVDIGGRTTKARDFDAGDRIQIHYHRHAADTPRVTSDGRVVDR